jgi:hypothetical protein
MNSASNDTLLALQALLAKELSARGVVSKASSPSSASVPKAKEKRAAGAWAAWTKHAPLAHAKEYAEFKDSSEEKQGVAPRFGSKWREDHPEEYAAFELAHKSSASVASSVASPVASVASVSKTKKWSEETKAKAKEKRAATKEAKKALLETEKQSASAPVAPVAPVASAPSEDDEEAELLPFQLCGRKYLRPGVPRGTEKPIWATGDLWEMKSDETRGDWVGVLEEDGSIDTSADEPGLA